MLKHVYKRLAPASTRRRLRNSFDGFFCRQSDDKELLGVRCRWTVLTRGLGRNSIVYSGGVGEDVSFETALIDRFGVTIQLFDPAPVARDTLAALSGRHRASLRFQPLGLAGQAEPAGFEKMEGDLGHFRKGSGVQWNCTTLKEQLQANGHQGIDLLKIDIEGFEYEVLESCLRDNILPTQICVEFHNFMGVRPWTDTASLLWKFRRRGYRIVHKSQYDYTLYRFDGQTAAGRSVSGL